MQPCSNVIDMQRCNKTSMMVAKKTANEFDSRKCKRNFEYV